MTMAESTPEQMTKTHTTEDAGPPSEAPQRALTSTDYSRRGILISGSALFFSWLVWAGINANDPGDDAPEVAPVADRRTTQQQSTRTVRVPDFVGASMADVDRWRATSQVFSISYGTEVGYTSSVSCRMQKAGTVLSQTPRAGTSVQVRSGQRVGVSLRLDC